MPKNTDSLAFLVKPVGEGLHVTRIGAEYGVRVLEGFLWREGSQK